MSLENRHFSKDTKKKANKHMITYLTLLVFRDTQNQNHEMLLHTLKNKTTENNKSQQGCG